MESFRPIRIGEVLRRIVGNVVMQIIRKMSSKLQDVYSYAPEQKLVEKQPSIRCTKYSMTLGMK